MSLVYIYNYCYKTFIKSKSLLSVDHFSVVTQLKTFPLCSQVYCQQKKVTVSVVCIDLIWTSVMTNSSRMTPHCFLRPKLVRSPQGKLPLPLPSLDQWQTLWGAHVPPGHVRPRVTLSLPSKSCTSRSATCRSLPKRRNSSDKYGSSSLCTFWQNNSWIEF